MATPEHPNVLLIMSDEHAPQYSSVYGHPIVVRGHPTPAPRPPTPPLTPVRAANAEHGAAGGVGRDLYELVLQLAAVLAQPHVLHDRESTPPTLQGPDD